MALTEEQRALVAQNRALVAHCPQCRADVFIAELPMVFEKAAQLALDAKCPGDPSHTLFVGANRE